MVTVSLPLPTPPVTVLNVDDGGFLWVRDSQSSLIALRTTRHVNVGKDGQGRLRIDGSRLTIGTSLQISIGGLGSGLVELHDSNLNVTQQIALGVGRMDEELVVEPGRLIVADSRVDVGASMLVGYLGDGVVEISGSSHVEMHDLFLGWEDQSYGSLNLDGGRVVNGGGATIGNSGTGFLNTLEGELGIGQDLAIGARAGGEGVVGLFGGQVNIGGDIFVGGSKDGPGGLGSLVIDRADVQVAGKLVAYPGAVVNLLGGRLQAEAIDLPSGQDLAMRGGELRVPRIDGSIEQQRGTITTVSSGGLGLGFMHISGDYVQSGGELRIEIGGNE
ncbi:MAG: hypothetical protein KDA51_19805, partial [Planctomycetales bacterium]|nr:hypothetical protein [Planctomycetales bacterium]